MSREQDKRVAEILGWKNVKTLPGFPTVLFGNHPRGNVFADVPNFTVDPAADYKVLEWARERSRSDVNFTFAAEEFCKAVSAEKKLEARRDFSSVDAMELFFYPGIFSRALLALDEQGLLK